MGGAKNRRLWLPLMGERPQKITFPEMREGGLRGLLVLRRLRVQPFDRDQR
jgi:hypothetical protein